MLFFHRVMTTVLDTQTVPVPCLSRIRERGYASAKREGVLIDTRYDADFVMGV